jgi:peptidase E
MTKYILIGGYPRKAPDGGKALAEEMVKGFDEPIKLLVCYFARPKYQWGVNMIEDKMFFSNHLKGKKIEFQTAKVETFIEQLKWADAIYIRGGRTDKLFKLLKKCDGWEKELNGKTLAGSSAGAMAIAKYDYQLDDLKIEEGFGLVPVKVLVHYRSNYNAPNIDWNKALKELKDYKEDLPILKLAEGQFEVINK